MLRRHKNSLYLLVVSNLPDSSRPATEYTTCVRILGRTKVGLNTYTIISVYLAPRSKPPFRSIQTCLVDPVHLKRTFVGRRLPRWAVMHINHHGVSACGPGLYIHTCGRNTYGLPMTAYLGGQQ